MTDLQMKKKKSHAVIPEARHLYLFHFFFFFIAAYSASYLLDRIIHLCIHENTTIIILN